MNNTYSGRLFLQALDRAEKYDIDMPAKDWAEAVGLMHDYGHGYEWEEFTLNEAIEKIEAAAEAEHAELVELYGEEE